MYQKRPLSQFDFDQNLSNRLVYKFDVIDSEIEFFYLLKLVLVDQFLVSLSILRSEKHFF